CKHGDSEPTLGTYTVFSAATSLLTRQCVGSVGREGGKALAPSPGWEAGCLDLGHPAPLTQPTQPTPAPLFHTLEGVGSRFGHPTLALHLRVTRGPRWKF